MFDGFEGGLDAGRLRERSLRHRRGAGFAVTRPDGHPAREGELNEPQRTQRTQRKNLGSYEFELRKFAGSQEAARRKSKHSFLISALSAFYAFFAV